MSSRQKHPWHEPPTERPRELMPEESLLHSVIALAAEEAEEGKGSARAWFNSREYRATCLVLGLSEPIQRRIREHANRTFGSRWVVKREWSEAARSAREAKKAEQGRKVTDVAAD